MIKADEKQLELRMFTYGPGYKPAPDEFARLRVAELNDRRTLDILVDPYIACPSWPPAGCDLHSRVI